MQKPQPYRDTQNLWLPGQDAAGRPRTHVDLPGYWGQTRPEQRRGGAGDAYYGELSRHLRQTAGEGALVVLDQINHATGRVESRFIGHNVLTDTLMNRIMALFFGTTGDASAATHYTGTTGTFLGQFLALDTASVYATQTGATISSGAQTAIACAGASTAGLVSGNASASFAAAASNNGTGQNVATPGLAADTTFGTGIAWSIGTANTEYVSGTTAGPVGSTSIPITSYTVTKSHVAGDYVIASPSCKDGSNSGAPAGIIYSTALTPTLVTTSGKGNRSALLSFTFSNPTYANGTYTGLWVVNTTTWAANVAYAHVGGVPQVIGVGNSIVASYTALF